MGVSDINVRPGFPQFRLSPTLKKMQRASFFLTLRATTIPYAIKLFYILNIHLDKTIYAN